MNKTKPKKEKKQKDVINKYKFSYMKQMRQRDTTSDYWLNSWGKGGTYAEMNPRDMIEGNCKRDIMGIDDELQFIENKDKDYLALTISGKLNMLKNWFYILHCYDVGDKITQGELAEK